MQQRRESLREGRSDPAARARCPLRRGKAQNCGGRCFSVLHYYCCLCSENHVSDDRHARTNHTSTFHTRGGAQIGMDQSATTVTRAVVRSCEKRTGTKGTCGRQVMGCLVVPVVFPPESFRFGQRIVAVIRARLNSPFIYTVSIARAESNFSML